MRQDKLRALVYAPVLPWFILWLRLATRAGRTVDDFVRIAETLRMGSLNIKPIQVHSELVALLGLVQKRKPKRILEIGTAHGGTLYLLARAAAPDALLLSIDLPNGPFGRGYPNWKLALFRSFAGKGQTIRFLRDNSHHKTAPAWVERALGAEKLDFLLIDGDHTYQGVKQDWEMYSPLVQTGAMVVFHDIVPGTEKRVGGVPRFWQELKLKYPHRELVESWDQNGFGIGILFISVDQHLS